MNIQVLQADALEVTADVLVLKYAQALYGVDELVVDRLETKGAPIRKLLPKPGGITLVDGTGQLGAKNVLFVGVASLRTFDYQAIREFARRALGSLAEEMPAAAHVAFTLHGAGYGLDEAEAFRSEIAGLIDGIESGKCPAGLQRLSIVERNVGRARRLQEQLTSILPTRFATMGGRRKLKDRDTSKLEHIRTAGAESKAKAHVFVAMPFASEFDDLFHYGIQQAVNAAGFLCERADLTSFTGDVILWVKERIDTASLLVADISTANPNVCLEVGYAWGKGIPTVLLATDAAVLPFDIKGQRCLVYKSIRKLEELLTLELKNLGGIARQ